VVGVIGHNGAGKSTLLKIISRITPPTRGTVEIFGRVGSLLEVGTGFHPELTGRDNIYMNGLILGMTKSEVAAKFDAIVAFAGVERFLDTPVKRYSSGMQTRLGFAVAIHLDPEILLVDEVLAVGDDAFQKRSIQAMNAASQEGRTVLVVSHNLGTIRSLCPRSLLLKHGELIGVGSSDDMVRKYLNLDMAPQGKFSRVPFAPGKDLFLSAVLKGADGEPRGTFAYGEDIILDVATDRSPSAQFGIEARLKNSRGEVIGYCSSWLGDPEAKTYYPGDVARIKFGSAPLTEDAYVVDLIARIPKLYHVDNWWDTIRFEITHSRPENSPLALRAADQLGNVIIPNVSFSRCEK
jgi:lipopolysaccharide transport system ATP-binding protein